MNIVGWIYTVTLAWHAVDHTQIPMGCTDIHRNLQGIRRATKWTGQPHNETMQEFKATLQKTSDILECQQFIDGITNRPVTFTKEEVRNFGLSKRQCPAITNFFDIHAQHDFSTLSAEEQAIWKQIEERALALKCFTTSRPEKKAVNKAPAP